MHHFYIFAISYFFYVSGSFLPNYIRTSFLILAFISLVVFFIIFSKNEKEKRLLQIKEIYKIKTKEECKILIGKYYAHYTEEISYSKEFVTLLIETENGEIVEGYYKKEAWLEKIKKHRGKIKVFYIDNYIIDIELLKKEDIIQQ